MKIKIVRIIVLMMDRRNRLVMFLMMMMMMRRLKMLFCSSRNRFGNLLLLSRIWIWICWRKEIWILIWCLWMMGIGILLLRRGLKLLILRRLNKKQAEIRLKKGNELAKINSLGWVSIVLNLDLFVSLNILNQVKDQLVTILALLLNKELNSWKRRWIIHMIS